ncbi:MAG: hypothetical protein ACW99L_16975, partial [Promethearchaeota archaeon]
EHYEKQFVNNPYFNSPTDFWFKLLKGDTSDVSGTINSGYANFEVLGEQRSFSLAADPPLALDWVEMDNQDFPDRPDLDEITPEGCRVSHEFDDLTAVQQPSVHWEQNYTYSGVDYIIFYVMISDLEKYKTYEIAYFQTEQIGSSNPPGKDYLFDTYMLTVPQEELIFYLESVLGTDNSNFTISLGIRLHIEDNLGSYWDVDTFDELFIKFVNLTFTYEKKIDQGSCISWNQISNKIIGSNAEIINANLTFKYKIDDIWPSLSPNSEIRILVNNLTHAETISLSSAETTIKDAKISGFDVTPLITKEKNITISIQVFMADEFTLDRQITISIDNVSLEIYYIVSVPDDLTSYDLILNGYNKSLGKSIEVVLGRPLSIIFKYTNSTGGFISNARMILFGAGSPKNLTENEISNEYSIVIDTSHFKLGENFLTLSVDKDYFQDQIHVIRVDILKRETDMQLFLNLEDKTNEKLITLKRGQELNITVKYLDTEMLPNAHITNANVELVGIEDSVLLDEDQRFQQYTAIIDASALSIGENLLTIHAQKENFSSISVSFQIMVNKVEVGVAPIFWAILTILLIVIGVLGALSIRTYLILPRKLKSRNALLSRTQKFKDAENIQGVLLIHTTSGLPLFSKNYSELMDGKNILFSGFIQAISLVSEEISYKKHTKIKINPLNTSEGIPKVIELDFKHFYCLVLDVEELRTVLILKNKSSKRLKTQLLNFGLSFYVKYSEILKDWDGNLTELNGEIPPYLDSYFNLMYKNYFELTIKKSDFEDVRKDNNLSRNLFKIMNKILILSEEKQIFKLIDLLNKLSNVDEDFIIDSIEKLIMYKIISSVK